MTTKLTLSKAEAALLRRIYGVYTSTKPLLVLGDTPERRTLQRLGLVESYRGGEVAKTLAGIYWRPTATGTTWVKANPS